MAYRVAFGMEGCSLTGEHFGDSEYFRIYEFHPDRVVFVEDRENTVREEEHEEHGEHHGNPRKFKKIVELLKDVDVFVAFRMGPNYVRVREVKRVIFTGTRDLGEAVMVVHRELFGPCGEGKGSAGE